MDSLPPPLPQTAGDSFVATVPFSLPPLYTSSLNLSPSLLIIAGLLASVFFEAPPTGRLPLTLLAGRGAAPACGHAFHAACVDAWLRTTPSCPLCRAAVSLPHPPLPNVAGTAPAAEPPHVDSQVKNANNSRSFRVEIDRVINRCSSAGVAASRKRGRESGALNDLEQYVSSRSHPFIVVPAPAVPHVCDANAAARGGHGAGAGAGGGLDAAVSAEWEQLRAGLAQACKRRGKAAARAVGGGCQRARRSRRSGAAAESQAWCGLARSNQAVVEGLRATLEALLACSSATAPRLTRGSRASASREIARVSLVRPLSTRLLLRRPRISPRRSPQPPIGTNFFLRPFLTSGLISCLCSKRCFTITTLDQNGNHGSVRKRSDVPSSSSSSCSGSTTPVFVASPRFNLPSASSSPLPANCYLTPTSHVTYTPSCHAPSPTLKPLDRTRTPVACQLRFNMDRTHWSQELTQFFLDALVDECRAGNRPNTTLNRIGKDNVLKRLQDFTGRPWKWDPCKNKWDEFKKKWACWRRLIKLSGVTYYC
ncbi:hypothetical protein U9M48_015222 [Paspalum notatum var. saurae]|uniref:RING-type domain-containing protein n=1 Tax=Paspalum notatum var. saurae TaxID=547442 RepID=A0AAQ3T625_PASNO